MAGQVAHILFLVIVLTILRPGSLCEINECFCDETEPLIMCGQDDAAEPAFTLMERVFTRNFYMTEKQLPLLDNLCDTFPTLDAVYYTGTTCISPLACAKLHCL